MASAAGRAGGVRRRRPRRSAKDSAGKEAPGAAAAPSREPRPALWLLADEDTKIYMFGTIHVLPPGFRWRSAALDKAVGESAELVVETYEPPGTETERPRRRGRFFAAKPVPILQRVPRNKRKRLKAAIEAAGLPMPVLDRMHSWAAAMTLGIAQMLGEYGVDDPAEAPGVEDVLEETFRGAGKPILSVEDGDAVLASMSALPEAVQTQLAARGDRSAGGRRPGGAGGRREPNGWRDGPRRSTWRARRASRRLCSTCWCAAATPPGPCGSRSG